MELLAKPIAKPGAVAGQHLPVRGLAKPHQQWRTAALQGRCRERSHRVVTSTASLTRRETVIDSGAFAGALLLAPFPWDEAQAVVRRPRKDIPLEEYTTNSKGVKYIDLTEGKGPQAEPGSTVTVHFDCIYRTLTVVSSRESKLLGGNRIIAEPYEFVVGSKPGIERKRDAVENANGLFSAQAAPKPPKVMYTATAGMRVGGKRRIIVTPDLGYGEKGFAEIPPGAEFELNIELLDVKQPAAA